MNISLEHLPELKREELQEIVKIILENSTKKTEMILLFGSHARGDWVEDRYTGDDGIVYEYRSDFDIMIVTSSIHSAQKWSYWLKIEKKLQRCKLIRTWVSLLVIDIQTLNKELKKGRYFYSDIRKEGIILYNSKKFELAEPKELTPEELKEEAARHFEKWFESANEFLEATYDEIKKQHFHKAAFELHQATERFFMTTLLVFTGYKPKLHDLEKLNRRVITQHRSFMTVFPQSTDLEKQNFILLKRAYIDSRYDMENFHITKEQLEWLANRVEKLKELTQINCQEKIESF